MKDCMPKEKLRNVVYSVKCGTCDSEYVGETQRALGVRKKEYCDAIRLGRVERSAVVEHVHAGLEPHEIDWQSLKVIDRASWKRERKIREAFHIGMRKPGMNRDIGVERSAIWDAVL